MAKSRRKVTFPARSDEPMPEQWLSIDPGGSKPTAVATWFGGRCTDVLQIDRARLAHWLHFADPWLIVLEEGFAGRINPQAAAQMSETRGVVLAVADLCGAEVVRVHPDQWRGVLGLPARRKAGEPTLNAAEAALCKLLPGVPEGATNADTRAAYLIGEAARRAWGVA